jgi:type II secretory ATPase GspE/PulE/Tfp pilus assembly ATPase PilB-like protein
MMPEGEVRDESVWERLLRNAEAKLTELTDKFTKLQATQEQTQLNWATTTQERDESDAKVRALTDVISAARAALSWDIPWIPGEHAYTQVKQRIDNALAILSPNPADPSVEDIDAAMLYQDHPDNTDFAGRQLPKPHSGPLEVA